MSIATAIIIIVLFIAFKEVCTRILNKTADNIELALDSVERINRVGNNKARQYEQTSELELELAKREKLAALAERAKAKNIEVKGLDLD